MAGLFLASSAIRSCFVDTLSGFKAPSCFSETTLFTTVPRFPRPGPPRAAFPDVDSTIRALRLPAPTTESLMYSLPRSDSASPSSLPRSGDLRMGLAPHPAAVPSLFQSRSMPDLPGSWGIHPIPLPRSRTPVGPNWSRHTAQLGVAPTNCTMKAPTLISISRLYHAALASAVYASSSASPHSHARLASGRWLAFTGWESNPLDSIEWFPLTT
jgi:hypothetical protein